MSAHAALLLSDNEGLDLDSATLYAREENSRGRVLDSIKEYDDILSALTDYQ